MNIRHGTTSQVRRLIVWNIQIHTWERVADVFDTELINNIEPLFRDGTVAPSVDESVTPFIYDYVEHLL